MANMNRTAKHRYTIDKIPPDVPGEQCTTEAVCACVLTVIAPRLYSFMTVTVAAPVATPASRCEPSYLPKDAQSIE